MLHSRSIGYGLEADPDPHYATEERVVPMVHQSPSFLGGVAR
jgi:hypothetical protein